MFWVYMFAHRDGPKPWLYIAVNLLIGLSCALPLYLYQTLKGETSSAAVDPASS